jgi:phosphoribosylaminoimidazolecarboxamide formyltransferase / IMP cyclohydrolase
MKPENTQTKIVRALLSVSDKTGLIEFARGLASLDVELLSTGGTGKHLKDAGLKVTDVSDHTGFPEMFDGRVKTLHPKVHGGLLQRRDNEEDQKNAAKHNIPVIDLVVVNLYAFEQTIAKKDATLEEAIENIDIGGPSMLRSAAKNHRWVTVVVDIEDYSRVLEEMENNGGGTTLKTRQYLSTKVFLRTSEYDSAIAEYLCAQPGYGYKKKA